MDEEPQKHLDRIERKINVIIIGLLLIVGCALGAFVYVSLQIRALYGAGVAAVLGLVFAAGMFCVLRWVFTSPRRSAR
jgi:hypothetical protein